MVCSTERPLIKSTIEQSGLEFHSYVLLSNNVDHKVAVKKITDAYGLYLSGFWMKLIVNDFTYMGYSKTWKYRITFRKDIIWDVPHGNLKDIWLAMGLIGFILVIAVLNFINLETANAHSRLKEIAVNKVNGASDLI